MAFTFSTSTVNTPTPRGLSFAVASVDSIDASKISVSFMLTVAVAEPAFPKLYPVPVARFKITVSAFSTKLSFMGVNKTVASWLPSAIITEPLNAEKSDPDVAVPAIV